MARTRLSIASCNLYNLNRPVWPFTAIAMDGTHSHTRKKSHGQDRYSGQCLLMYGAFRNYGTLIP